MSRLRGAALPLVLVVVTVLAAGSLVLIAPGTAQACEPVYRFFNTSAGTHFYTASPEERTNILAKWPTTFRDEGIAYYTNIATNTLPLYRFRNTANGTHFYTASADEKAAVEASLAGVLVLEGEAYKVSPVEVAGGTTVYRFFNRVTGSHFYTASIEERDRVKSLWSSTYTDEGVGYYLAP